MVISRNPRLVAISDDLTGAAAVAAEFRAAGMRSAVSTSLAWPSAFDAIVVDTGSRQIPAADAARRVGEIVAGTSRVSGATLYKRIDSALRGHVAAELEAVTWGAARSLLVAAAAPALGVTTRAGVQTPAEGHGRIADLLPGASRELDLELVRRTDLTAVLRRIVADGLHVVTDAETTEDLARVARAAAPLADQLVPVGSYGFGRAWADELVTDREPAVGVLVAVGSIRAAARVQVAHACERGARLSSDPFADAQGPAAFLAAGDDVILASAGPEQPAPGCEIPDVAGRLATSTLAVARRAAASPLLLVGGELGSEVIRRSQATSLDVVAEPWPTAVVLRVRGGVLDDRLMLVKSGSQGSAEWLSGAIGFLRSLAACTSPTSPRHGCDDA